MAGFWGIRISVLTVYVQARHGRLWPRLDFAIIYQKTPWASSKADQDFDVTDCDACEGKQFFIRLNPVAAEARVSKESRHENLASRGNRALFGCWSKTER
jgi:hypothetical protein